MMDGCLVYTTAEIVIGEATDLTFSREEDSITHFKELKIVSKEPADINREHINKPLPK